MKLFLLLLLFVCATAFASQGAQTVASGSYRVVAAKSHILIKTGTAGVFGFAGHDHLVVPSTVSGTVTAGSQDPAQPSVSITIDSASLHETGPFTKQQVETIEKGMHGEVLETAKYPEITFHSTNVKYSQTQAGHYSVQVEGELQLHGVTRKIAVPVQVSIEANGLRATGALEVKRDDYNIKTTSAGGGTVKVANTMKVSFDIVAEP